MDFLVFARLLAAASLIPDLSWVVFLREATPLISTPLDETIAIKTHGAAAVEELRALAAVIYGSPVDDEPTPAYAALRAAVVRGDHQSSAAWFADDALFRDVGGVAPWRALLDELPPATAPPSSAGSSAHISSRLADSLLADLQQSKSRATMPVKASSGQ
jgi:hypothetical protein